MTPQGRIAGITNSRERKRRLPAAQCQKLSTNNRWATILISRRRSIAHRGRKYRPEPNQTQQRKKTGTSFAT